MSKIAKTSQVSLLEKYIKYSNIKIVKIERRKTKVECIYIPKNKELTLKITEEIDEHSTDVIRRKIDNEIARFLPRKVILDFSNVTFMDSAGIGMIIGRYKIIKMLGGELLITNTNKQVKKILEISGIFKIIPLIKNKKEEVI